MRLKEIKLGMVIHCKTEEEIKRSLIELDKLGCEWVTNDKLEYAGFLTTRNEVCFHVGENMKISWSDFKESMNEKTNITEFSDLIIPELSAKEVLETIGEICSLHHSCELDNCPLYLNHKSNLCQNKMLLEESEKVVDICTKWREEHPKEEKKELETEWVYVVRIIKVENNGFKKCVYEEDFPALIEKPTVEDVLKHYCSEHKGNFFATLEHICRIKE